MEETPGHPAVGLTYETAEVGQRIEVWGHPNCDPVAFQGERGRIRYTLPAGKLNNIELADVALDGFGNTPLFMPIAHLIPERKTATV